MPGDDGKARAAGAGASAGGSNADQMTLLTNVLKLLTENENRRQPFFQMWEKETLRGSAEEDVHKFFEHFEYLSNLVENMNDEIRFIELRKCLRDKALSVFQGASENDRSNYERSKSYLLKNLALPHQQAIFRHAFQTRKKGEREAVADYFRDLKRLAEKAYGGHSADAINLVLKTRFIEGLTVSDRSSPNFKIWRAAFTQSHEDLERVLAEAQSAETTQNSVRLVSDVATNLTSEAASLAFQSAFAGTSRPARGSGRRGRRFVRDRGGFQHGQSQRGQFQHGQFQRGHQQYAQSHQPGNRACYECGDEGHIRARCPNLRAAQLVRPAQWVNRGQMPGYHRGQRGQLNYPRGQNYQPGPNYQSGSNYQNYQHRPGYNTSVGTDEPEWMDTDPIDLSATAPTVQRPIPDTTGPGGNATKHESNEDAGNSTGAVVEWDGDDAGEFDGWRPPTPTTGERDEQTEENARASPSESLASVVRKTRSMALGDQEKISPRVLRIAKRLQRSYTRTNREWKRRFETNPKRQNGGSGSNGSTSAETLQASYTRETEEESALLGEVDATVNISPEVEAALLENTHEPAMKSKTD